MAAAQQAQAVAAAGLAAHLIRPGPGGVDDEGRPRFERAPPPFGRLVAQRRSADLARPVAQQRDGAGVVERQAAGADRLACHPQHKPGIVGLGVEIAVSAVQAAEPQRRTQADQGGRPIVRMLPFSGQDVVERQPAAEDPSRQMVPLEARHQERQWVDQPAAFAQEQFPLAHRVDRRPDLQVAQVAQAAVDQLGRTAGGAAGEIAGLDEQRPQSEVGGLAQDSGAGDSATQDQQVPRPGGLLPNLVAPATLPHVGSTFSRGVSRDS
jgi:hypothetical protein